MLLRNFLLLVSGLTLLFLQSHPYLPFGRSGLRPDLVLVFVVFIGLHFSPIRGSLICFGMAYCLEVLSGTNSGLFILTAVSIFIFIKTLKKYFDFDSFVKQALLMLFCLGVKFGLYFLAFVFIYEYRFFNVQESLLEETVFTLLLFPFVFLILGRILNRNLEPETPYHPLANAIRNK